MISYLTEELVKQGHEVTLFSSADSVTAATLIPCAPRSLRKNPTGIDPLALHLLEVERVAQREAEFDVIHAHLDHLPYSLARVRPRLPPSLDYLILRGLRVGDASVERTKLSTSVSVLRCDGALRVFVEI